jgi:hypothetical protein
MSNVRMINWENIFQNSKIFQNNKPFPFGFIENFFEDEFYEKLFNSYPKIDEKWENTNDFGRSAMKRFFGDADYNQSDKCSIDQEDASLSKSWNEFFHYIHTDEFIKNMSKYTNIQLKQFRHFSFITNSKGSFNMPHTHHPNEKKEDYSYNITMLIYFAKGWKPGEAGGTYISSEEDESTIIFEPHNLDNSCVIFAETPNSWHGSRYMIKDAVRNSIQFTLL